MANSTTNIRTPAALPVDLLAVVGGFAEVASSRKTTADELGDTHYLEHYLKHLEQLGEAAGERGYAGLQGVCMLFQENVLGLRERDGGLGDEVRGALDVWPELVRSYLELPLTKTVSRVITNHLQLPLWDTPLAPDDAEMLNGLLVEEHQGVAIDEETGSAVADADAFTDEDTAIDEMDILVARPADELQGAAAEEKGSAVADADAYADEGTAIDETDILVARPADELQGAAAEETGSADEFADADVFADEGTAANDADILVARPADELQSTAAEETESADEFADTDACADEGTAVDETDILIALPADELQGAAAEETESADEFVDADAYADEGTAADDADILIARPADEPQGVAAEETESADEFVDADAYADEGTAADDADILVALPADELQGAVAEETGNANVAVDADGLVDERVAAIAAGQPEEVPEEELPPEVRELVEVLIAEIPLMEEPLAKLLELELAEDGDPAAREEACELYTDYLDRFAEAAEAVGFVGLQQVVALMRENLGHLVAQRRAFSAGEMDALAAWSGYAGVYLSAPHSASACQALVEWLQAPDWPRPLTAEEAEVFLALLQAPTLPEAEEDEAGVARRQIAESDDVSLALPEDVNTELLDALLQELPIQSQTFSEAIQNLIAGGSLDDVNVAQRTAHTLKGAGNTVGVFALANLTHHLEDILAALAKQQALPTRPLAMSLMNAADCLEAMGEALSGMGEPPDNARAVLQEVLDWANHIDREGLPTQEDEAPPPPLQAQATEAQPAAPAAAAPQEPERQSQPAAPRAQVATSLVDNLLRMGGETLILSGQVHEQVYRLQERMGAMQAEFERLQALGGELERLIDIRDLSTDGHRQQENLEFDSLEMDQYSELHTTSRMLVEAATDARQMGGMVTDQLQRLDKTLLTQERLNRETQEIVLSARMVPVKTVVPRLQRSVRQTCRLTGKQVQLHVSGADTLMDGEVLNELIDPLMHVLRNAVDHGIESPEQRSSAGKPDSGNIWLDLLREGNNILVRCRDDGAGFDFAAIRRAAESRGLLEPGKDASEEELKNLMLLPNFSSRAEVTQTSGRGVGLDVVYSHVLSHGGSMTLKSEASKGSTTELRLPASLISTHALLVRVRGQVVAVADRGIEQILHAADGKERKVGGRPTFQVGEQLYPLRQLEEILGLAPDSRSRQRAQRPVLLVRNRTGVTAVTVQEVSAGTDLVVKEFGRYLPRLPGIVGATILGDGAVTPVLDLSELMSGAHAPARQAASAATADAERKAPRLPLALVVDDSLSARRALVQVMEDSGYEVRAARDGLEAAEIAQGRRPDIVLADMEMPRMNGIELTFHLRARQETADLPVIMITSRSSAKHRKQAEAAGVNVYLTKPFSDDELLDHVAALRGQS